MSDNKDFTWPEEELPEVYNVENEPEEEAGDLTAETLAEFAPEAPQEPEEEITSASAESEIFQGSYRGAGAGRKESPFADSPYVMPHRQTHPEPEEPVYRRVEPEFVPRKKRNPRKRLGRKLLAAGIALLVLAGSCGLTGYLVNRSWRSRAEAMEKDFSQQLKNMQKQIDALSPANTGMSVSGTVAVGDGYTAGQVYAQNVHSVVLIESTVVSNVYGQTATGVAFGSGFILSEDGYVVTNYHVVEGATSVNVVLYDGRTHPAQVVGYDSTNDIALLKVEANGLDAVELGSSDALIVGDQVVAIGNPLGELTSTLTVGYVSAKERTVSTDGTIINMIQTDAAINSGNSGGPLFNMKGQVVGITTAKYSGASSSGATIEGIGFAIPIDDVLEEIEELKEFGYIKSAYLGVLVQNMDASVAGIYGLPVGAYVAGVEEGYCAARAGIQAKDIIVAVGDEEITTITDLTRALRSYEPGDRAKLTVYRAGQYLTISVVLDERPADADTIVPVPEG